MPRSLRASRLPWSPSHEDQAAAPRDGDCWIATVGPYQWRLEAVAHQINLQDPLVTPCEPRYELELHASRILQPDRFSFEEGNWSLPSLQPACEVVDELLEPLLEHVGALRDALNRL